MATSPLKFCELGQDAEDLLSKGFHLSQIKLEGTTVSATGTKFTATVDNGIGTSGEVEAGVEMELAPSDGVSFTESWNAGDNLFSTNLSIAEGKLAAGLSADIHCHFSPLSGKKSAAVKMAYKRDMLSSTLDLDLADGLTVHGSSVALYKGMLLGGQGSYDTSGSKLVGSGFGLSFCGDDFTLHSGIENLSQYFGSVYHRVSDKLSTATSVGWSTDGNDASPSLTIGAQYTDGDSVYKARVCNGLQVALSYATKLRDGVQLTLASSVDGKALKGGDHKFGVVINLST